MPNHFQFLNLPQEVTFERKVQLSTIVPIRSNLNEAVAGRERHLVEVGGVPRAHDYPAVLGPVLYRIDHVGQLWKSGGFPL